MLYIGCYMFYISVYRFYIGLYRFYICIYMFYICVWLCLFVSASANVVRKSLAQVMLRAPVPAVAGAGGVGGFVLRSLLTWASSEFRHPVYEVDSAVSSCPSLAEQIELFLLERRASLWLAAVSLSLGASFALGLSLGCCARVACRFASGCSACPRHRRDRLDTQAVARVEGYFAP